MIHLHHLVFSWKKPQKSFSGLNNGHFHIPHLHLDQGERVLLHGASGSGKSTLLGLIAAVHRPYRGDLTVAGIPLFSGKGYVSRRAADAFRADHIGYVFQQFNLLPYLSVLDNVLLSVRFSAKRSAQLGGRQDKAAQDMLSCLDLPANIWHKPVTELSVGQQQRVAVARALLGKPAVILADEPTSALDEAHQQAFLQLLLAQCLEQKSTLLMVSHDMRLAKHFDRALAMEDLLTQADKEGVV